MVSVTDSAVCLSNLGGACVMLATTAQGSPGGQESTRPRAGCEAEVGRGFTCPPGKYNAPLTVSQHGSGKSNAMAVSMLLAAVGVVACAWAKEVVLSNVDLPRDTDGRELLTGEATILYASDLKLYFAYFNNWGACAGVDCCPSSGGCSSCCFNPPSEKYPDACVYTANHSVVAYSTPDFATWKNEGTVLALGDRLPGIEFRPQVIFSPLLSMYLMWYEDRWTSGSNRGYAINAAATPRGPFRPLTKSVELPGAGRVGDYDLFVDDDGVAYHVRTGITIVQLNASRTGPSGRFVNIPSPSVEGPAMFKRSGVYYVLVGKGCCACKGGSNIEVYTAPAPLGPYAYQGDVGSYPAPFDPHSPHNYVTNAQQTKVLPVPAADGSVQYLWVGNQWVTSPLPGRPRNNDRLYWSVLQFNGTAVLQFAHADQCTISVPDV